jgi:DNA helicase II / ATP-dependent DNA helicase PcrA
MKCDAAQFETVAAVTCQKPAGETPDQCFGRRRDQPFLCRGHDKCRLAGMTVQQMTYVLHPVETESYLKACPGSGKTESVAVRAAYLLGARQWTTHGIAFLTFTNNAADVIRERVARTGRASSAYPHFIGTFDSWLHGYVLNPFGHHATGYAGKSHDRSVAIIENSSAAVFLHAYKTAQPLPACGHVFAHQFYFEPDDSLVFASGEHSLDAARANIAWSAEQLAELKQIKETFWKAGFATYADVETICLRLLRKFPRLAGLVSKRFPFIVVDECQDLGPGQLALLEELRKAGAKLHFVGDRHQAIYSFRKADAAQVIGFATQRNFTELPLTENFRSVQPIVDFCGKLVAQGPINVQPTDEKEVACIYLTYEKPEDIGALVARFDALLALRKIDPAQSVILARGSTMLARLDPTFADKRLNTAHEFARCLYLWKTAFYEVRSEALQLVGSVIADVFFPKEAARSRSHHQPLSFVSASAWRLLLAEVLNLCVADPALANLDQTWSKWAALAKGKLPAIAHSVCEDCDAAIIPSFSAPQGLTQQFVSASFNPPADTKSKLKCSTIHKVKGQTVSAVLVVSSPDARSKGGHWSQWLDQSLEDGEYSRFAYVASSRPRFLLAWAIRTPKTKAEIERVNALGLSLVP